MGTMGKYCKAYLLSQFQDYPDWPGADSLQEFVGKEDDTVVYLQENYAVTADVYMDEDIIFESDSDEWRSFCENELDFEVSASVIEAEKAVEKDWDDFVLQQEQDNQKEAVSEVEG